MRRSGVRLPSAPPAFALRCAASYGSACRQKMFGAVVWSKFNGGKRRLQRRSMAKAGWNRTSLRALARQPGKNLHIMKSPLKDKWVLITGASSGFGAAAARAFGAEGAKLLLGARRVDRLRKVAAETKRAGEAHFHFLDVARTASVEEFVSWTKEKIGSRKAEGGNRQAAMHRS